MYLSAWDEEHFVILLETLMGMAAGREKIPGIWKNRAMSFEGAYGCRALCVPVVLCFPGK